jgi:Mn2+/Fe2+ NRAMP family transporter
MNAIKKFFRRLGPGMVTGTADNDPSGIATYSQTGAQFGLGQLWTALFMLPFLIAVQEACGRIGAITGTGIAAVIKKFYSVKILYLLTLLVLIANAINIGADLGAMAQAMELLIPLPSFVFIGFFALLILALEIFVSYKVYARMLKWLCLSLFAYPATLFMIHMPWSQVLKATVIPHIEGNFQFLFIITGVFGTTISPYLFFWQASQEVEETKAKGLYRHTATSRISRVYLRNLRLDNFIGMLFSEFTTWSIIVVTAVILHNHGITDIKTAADAAKALEPFVHGFPHAGLMAKAIFALGIIGLGLLSIPVLAGSAAYALSETLGLKSGLNLKFNGARGFYGIIILATAVGVALNFIHVDPMKALVYAAVLNGIVAVPLILMILLIISNPKIMGVYTSKWLSKILVAITFIAMLITAIALLVSSKS